MGNSKSTIGIIRHFPVDKKLPKGFVLQSEMLAWLRSYEKAPILSKKKLDLSDWDICLSSPLNRALATAKVIYHEKIFIYEALKEPTPCPIFAADIRLPAVLWLFLLRVLYLTNHQSQSDRKKVLYDRIEGFLSQILTNPPPNILIVSHLCVMEILSEILVKRGYQGIRLKRPVYGKLYVFTH